MHFLSPPFNFLCTCSNFKLFSPFNHFIIGASRFSNGISPSDLPKITNESKSKRNRGSVVAVSHKLGTPEQECPEWLVATAKDQLPQPERLAFTPPARGEGESSIYICFSCKDSRVSNVASCELRPGKGRVDWLQSNKMSVSTSTLA